jgi:hypothetical protein
VNTLPAEGAAPPASDTVPSESGGNTPPIQEGNTEGEAAQQQQGGTGTQGTAPPAAGDNKPPVPPTESGGKKRVKCGAMKGKKVIVGKGEVVQIDENGCFEVEAEEAERLLTIPGYEEA